MIRFDGKAHSRWPPFSLGWLGLNRHDYTLVQQHKSTREVNHLVKIKKP